MPTGLKKYMNEEEKKAAEAAEAAKKTAAEEAEKKPTDTEVALKEERERREKAEHDLEETRRKAKERIEEKRKKEAAGESDDNDEQPITRRAMKEMLEEERETVRKELRQERVSELATKISENPAEAELVVEVWKNRTLIGTLEEQIAEAHAIATRKRTLAQNAELKRALAGEEGVVITGENAERKPVPKDAPTLTGGDKQVLAGYIWDNAKSAYRKTIAGGQKVYFVSRDLKKRWIENTPKK